VVSKVALELGNPVYSLFRKKCLKQSIFVAFDGVDKINVKRLDSCLRHL